VIHLTLPQRFSSFESALRAQIAMILAALIEWGWGVDAERKPLEAVASPLTFVE
jgi:hypothetical protein